MIWWTQDLSALTTARPAPAASFSEAPAPAELEGADAALANVTPIRPPVAAAPSHLHPNSAEPCYCTDRIAS